METNRRRNTGEVFICIQVIYGGFAIKPNLREEAIKMLFFCRRGGGSGGVGGGRGASEGEERLAFIFIQRVYSFNCGHAGGRCGRGEERKVMRSPGGDVTVTDATAVLSLWNHTTVAPAVLLPGKEESTLELEECSRPVLLHPSLSEFD